MKMRKFVAFAMVMTTVSALAGYLSANPQILPQPFEAAGTRDAEINVYPTEVVAAFGKEISGVAYNTMQGRLWDTNTGELKPGAVEYLSALHPGSVRWPSGMWNRYFRWAEMIGPMNIRSNAPFVSVKQAFGPDEVVQESRRLRQNTNFSIGINSHQTPAEAADFVEYMNGTATNCGAFDPNAWLHGASTAASGYTPGSMPTGYYACLRAHPDYGNSAEPYGVTHWEIGNEDYAEWNGLPLRTPEEYRDIVLTLNAAIKAKDASAKTGAVLFPTANSAWNSTILALYPATVDFFIHHAYATGGITSTGINSNYEIAVPFEVAEARAYQFTITARGQAGGTCPWPNMRVKTNGGTSQDFSVNSTSAQNFQYTTPVLPVGSHHLQIGLTNDCYQFPNGDTNLKIDKVVNGPSLTGGGMNLIHPGDYVRALAGYTRNQTEGMVSHVRNTLSLPAGSAVPLFVTELGTVFGRGFTGEHLMNRSMVSAFYVGSTLHHLAANKVFGAHFWQAQERCIANADCTGNLLYFDGDDPASYQNAVGNPYGTADYWLYRQLAASADLQRVRAEVVNPETFQPVTYIERTPSNNIPYIQTWATKAGDDAFRLHVIYLGDETLNLRLKVNGYQVRSELDVAQLRHNDLLAISTATDKTKVASYSTRISGGNDEVYEVSPLSISSFTFYKHTTQPPPPGGGGGSIYVENGTGVGSGGSGNVGGGAGTTRNRSGGSGDGGGQVTAPVTNEGGDGTVILPEANEHLPQIAKKRAWFFTKVGFWQALAVFAGLLAAALWIVALQHHFRFRRWQHSV